MKIKEKVEDLGKLNELKIIKTKIGKRTRVQLDFSNCVSKTDQSAAHATDVNYLIQRYQPDELAAYLAAKNANRQEITGHDFSQEPSLQEAKNRIVEMKQLFESLNPELKTQFPNYVEFIKFLNNPDNTKKLVKLGLMTEKQVQKAEALVQPTTTGTKETNPSSQEATQ